MATDQFTIPESKVLSGPEVGNLWTRRKFFGLAGWAAFLGAIQVLLLAFVRFMYPRVLFEPSPIFKAGFPNEYQVGEVSERYVESHRVWIVRETKGLYAILAICTHLGCTPKWLKAEQKFKCPCHGSGFYKSAINFEGPAPRPLERLKLTLADDGQLVIDRSKKFPDPLQWNLGDAFLKYTS